MKYLMWLTGFALSLSHSLNARAQDKRDSVTTAPLPLQEVVVSATRSERRIESLPSPVQVIGTPAIQSTSSGSVPDLLRSVPGFTLRDYQSGVISGPSQSIVTVRGLGGSSAGRVLVLLDGLPIGDPFSGWIDWGRIPLPMLASAEVIRGGGSIIWGSRALGGVVNLRTIEPLRNEATLLVEGGSFSTSHAAGAATLKRGKISAVLAADYLDTDGFIITPPDQAGPVDKPQATRNGVVTGKIKYDASSSVQAWISGSLFQGGDPPWGVRDDQVFNEGRAGLRWLSQSGGIVTLSAFANERLALSKSFSVNTDRTTETPQRFGRSPAKSRGVFLQWTQLVRNAHELSSGADFTFADGSFAEEYAFAGDIATQQRRTAGNQVLAGAFIQDAADLGYGVRMVASARIDRVSSSDAQRTVRNLPSRDVLSDSAISDHSDTRPTWSLGFRKQQARWLGVRLNGYEAFRAPSMYEMYYPRFSSRGTVTEANAALAAERLRGLEGGFDVTLGRNGLARITAFTNRVASPIMDITIGTAGNAPQVIEPCGLMPARQTCSQRENVHGLRSNGIESDARWHPLPSWSFNAAYSYSATRVSAPGQPADGKEALRSPSHTAVAGASFDKPHWFSLSAEARYVGRRFEDDLNTIELDPFTVVGLRLNRNIGSRTTAHLKHDNLLDKEFDTTRTRAGLAERGSPRWITVGLRTRW
jgi:outer membrane cobalamin receptor